MIVMKDYGDNCRYCLCATCNAWKICGTLNGNTEEWCEEECLGENSQTEQCSDYEKE